VVQCYVGEKSPRLLRPPKELKAAQRVFLKVGQTEQITLQIAIESLAYFDEADSRWHRDEGVYQVFVGSSSRDIRWQGEFSLVTGKEG
jgi:beta-glucosidase